MYRIWGKEGHRQKASWQKSVIVTTKDGYTIETWCFDKTGTHEYIDMEVSRLHCTAMDLYEEMQTQLDDGFLECCNYGKIEKLKYSYYWSTGCPTNIDFNNAVSLYEDILNNYASDEGIIPYIDQYTNDYYVPLFHGNKFTAVKRCV